MKEYDFIIVGSGLYGSTFNFLAKQDNKKCLIIEKRNHIGGNLFCENVENILVHNYGPHIFHTNNQEIWDFVTSLVSFNNYINSPKAKFGNELYSLPFNMNTFHELWGITTPQEAHDIINAQKYKGTITNLQQQAESIVGHDIFNKLIKNYTEKQLGRPCTDLPADIIRRLPVRYTYNNNYFNDKYQGIPINGYNELIEKLIGNTEVILNVDFNENQEKYINIGEKIIYTGPIDAFFHYKYGKLEYRSLRFDTEILETSNFQGNAVINYTDKTPYTRIIEHKHFSTFNDDIHTNPKTVITKEYPIESSQYNEPYYPIHNDKNLKLLTEYQNESINLQNVYFAGRLSEYKYYDMDDTIESVFKLYNSIIKTN